MNVILFNTKKLDGDSSKMSSHTANETLSCLNSVSYQVITNKDIQVLAEYSFYQVSSHKDDLHDKYFFLSISSEFS